MRVGLACALLALGFTPGGIAQGLPELGDNASLVVTQQLERRVGEEYYREIRLRDPKYLDDPEIANYVSELGARLAAATEDARSGLEFFVMKDPTLNAFAMPGGFIGINTGTILAAQSESELAAVMSHEIAHVTQRHIARMVGRQSQMSMPMLAAMLLAIIASRSSPEAASAAMIGANATAVQAQIDFTREYEREADRVGFQILERAGFDVNGMASFFERMLKAGRSYENNAPSYLRTHPLSTERMADMQNRAQNLPYRQVPDSMEFQLARGKLRAELGLPREAVQTAEELLREKRYASEPGARYSLVSALVRAKDFARAGRELGALRAVAAHPMVDLLAARVRIGLGDQAGAKKLLADAMERRPNYRPLQYAWVEALQALGDHKTASVELTDLIRTYPKDARLYSMQARSFHETGRRLQAHQALAEQYVLMGTLPAAIEQLEMAQKAGDGDFFQLSAIDARLRDLRRELAEQTRQK